MAKSAFARTVGYIGLGDMGGAIAVHLAEAGVDIIVFDLKPAAMAVVAAKGARTAATLAELAAMSDVLIICVDPEPQVPRIIESLLEFLRPGQTVIVQSSVRPQIVIDDAARVATKGARLFDAPVSGSNDDRRNGTLAVPAGTSREDAGDLHELLATIGHPIYLNALGGGQVAKLANNAVMCLTRTGLIEMMEMAGALGVAAGDLLEVMKVGSARSFVVENWGFYEDLARKGHVLRQQKRQTGEILDVARHIQVALPMTQALYERSTAIDEGHYRRLTGSDPAFDY